jgi:phage shock protein A
MDRTKATLQDWLERAEAPETSPLDTLAQLEREMETLEQTASALIGTERELLGRLEDASFLSAELGNRAAKAAEEGREHVARQMLEEKCYYDDIAVEMYARYQEARAHVQQLVEKLYALKEQAFELRKQSEQRLRRRPTESGSNAAKPVAAAPRLAAEGVK